MTLSGWLIVSQLAACLPLNVLVPPLPAVYAETTDSNNVTENSDGKALEVGGNVAESIDHTENDMRFAKKHTEEEQQPDGSSLDVSTENGHTNPQDGHARETKAKRLNEGQNRDKSENKRQIY